MFSLPHEQEFDPFSTYDADGTIRGYTHDFLAELMSTAFPDSLIQHQVFQSRRWR